MTTYYDQKPQAIKYNLRPDGRADVWLRKNIKEVEVQALEEGAAPSTNWQAEEEYFETDKALNTIMEERLTQYVQSILDQKANEKRYDSALTCISYKDSTDENFRAEALKFITWRDKVWRTCYDIMAVALNGQKYIETWEGVIPNEVELQAALPAFVW